MSSPQKVYLSFPWRKDSFRKMSLISFPLRFYWWAKTAYDSIFTRTEIEGCKNFNRRFYWILSDWIFLSWSGGRYWTTIWKTATAGRHWCLKSETSIIFHLQIVNSNIFINSNILANSNILLKYFVGRKFREWFLARRNITFYSAIMVFRAISKSFSL